MEKACRLEKNSRSSAILKKNQKWIVWNLSIFSYPFSFALLFDIWNQAFFQHQILESLKVQDIQNDKEEEKQWKENLCCPHEEFITFKNIFYL